MSRAASISDLEEVAEGRASAGDKREAGVESIAEARKALRGRRATKTRTHTTKAPRRKVRRRR